jgi:hypothetical protein
VEITDGFPSHRAVNAAHRSIAGVGRWARGLVVAASLAGAGACSSSSDASGDACCNVPLSNGGVESAGGCGCPGSASSDAGGAETMVSCVVNAGAGNTCTVTCMETVGDMTVSTTSNPGSRVPYCPGVGQ